MGPLIIIEENTGRLRPVWRNADDTPAPRLDLSKSLRRDIQRFYDQAQRHEAKARRAGIVPK